MNCPTCGQPGKRGHTMSTLLAHVAFADAAGVVHEHDPNCHHREWSCSSGHRWRERVTVPCPACGWTVGPCAICGDAAASAA